MGASRSLLTFDLDISIHTEKRLPLKETYQKRPTIEIDLLKET